MKKKIFYIIIILILIATYIYLSNYFIDYSCDTIRLTSINSTNEQILEETFKSKDIEKIKNGTDDLTYMSANFNIKNKSKVPIYYIMPIYLNNKDFLLESVSPEVQCDCFIQYNETVTIPIGIVTPEGAIEKTNECSFKVYFLYFNGFLNIKSVTFNYDSIKSIEYNE